MMSTLFFLNLQFILKPNSYLINSCIHTHTHTEREREREREREAMVTDEIISSTALLFKTIIHSSVLESMGAWFALPH
jgi:hypothetical protein